MNRIIAILFAIAVGALIMGPILAGSDPGDVQAVGAELDLDIDALPNLGNLTGEIMIEFVLEPGYHVDHAANMIIVNKEDLSM